MTVFENALTPSVMAMIFGGLLAMGGSNANGIWVYQVEEPQKPSIAHVKHLTDPSVAQIQDAIDDRTRIEVIGTVNASGGQKLMIEADDVRLSFKQAQVVNWSGGDDWGGFLEISGRRVEVMHLRLDVQGAGRCRGVVIHSPASDIRLLKCEFRDVADGFIADGNWKRMSIEDTSFLECADWSSGSMDGGYGMFLEDDDSDPDHLRLSNVEVTLAGSSGQHGIRISKVQNALIEDSFFGANGKRSMWAYGVSRMTVRRTTFDTGSVMFNLKPFESQTDRPTEQVRIYDCEINHTSVMEPLQVYCGKGTLNFLMKDVDITSTSSNKALMIGWRSDVDSEKVRWYDGSVTFNGQPIWGEQWCKIDDWSNQELESLTIGCIPDPRNN